MSAADSETVLTGDVDVERFETHAAGDSLEVLESAAALYGGPALLPSYDVCTAFYENLRGRGQ